MLKILQAHLLRAFVANSIIDGIYALYLESFCNKNLAVRKVFAFSDSAPPLSLTQEIFLKDTIFLLLSIHVYVCVYYHLFCFTCFFPGTGDAFSQAKLQVSSYRDSVTRNNTQMSHETLLQVTHDSTICKQHYKYLYCILYMLCTTYGLILGALSHSFKVPR